MTWQKQCEKFSIFMLLRFLREINFRGSDFWFFMKFFAFSEGWNLPKSKIQSHWNCKNGIFWTFTFFKIDFTQNQSDRKISQLPHSTVWKTLKICSHVKDISWNHRLVKKLVWRNFCLNSMWVKYRNFHTVWHCHVW